MLGDGSVIMLGKTKVTFKTDYVKTDPEEIQAILDKVVRDTQTALNAAYESQAEYDAAHEARIAKK